MSMRAIKEARKLIEREPQTITAQTLSRLVLALENQSPFSISELYSLNYDHFNLALEILKDWRIDRYYASKVKLFDVSTQAAELPSLAIASPKA
jgi:hypothetical protein